MFLRADKSEDFIPFSCHFEAESLGGFDPFEKFFSFLI